MSRKAIDGKKVILLTVILTISTFTLTILPPATASALYTSGATEYPWPLGGHDLNRTRYTDAPGPQTNQTYWIYKTANKVRGAPAVVDGIVYIGSDDDILYALDMDTGSMFWSYTTGDNVRSSPAVYDGKVYFGSRDGNVYCLTAGWTGGSLVWSWPSLDPSPTGEREVRSSPAVADGKVVIGSRDSNIYCLDASTGASIWNYTTDDDVRSGPAIFNGLVYIGGDDNKLYCLHLSNGSKLWEYDTGSDVYRTPAISDGLVFAASNSKKTVYALNMTTGVSVRNYTVTGDIRGGPAIAEGKLYVAGTSDGVVSAFNISTGASLWNHSTAVGSWYGIPAVADGLVFVIAMDGYVYALDMDTGAVVWKYLTGATSANDYSYGAVADGFLFIGSGDENVYAFGEPPLRPLLFMDPASIIDQYTTNQNFTVEVKTQNVTDLYSWYIGVQWNPDILECTAVDYVDTFLPDQATYPDNYADAAGTINNTEGNMSPPYSRNLSPPNLAGVNGSGTLLNVTFRVKAYGDTWINFTDDTELLNSTANTITVSLENCLFKLPLPPPEACFTQTPPTLPYIVNETVITFNATCSQPGFNGTHDVPIANYTWDFGDGNNATLYAPNATVTHMYNSTGTFTVNLTIMCEDDPVLIAEGLTSNSTWKELTVTIVPPSTPVASFTVSPPPYYASVTVVSFNASGSEPGSNGTDDVPIANYTWDFGDGNVTTVDAPTATVTHVYSSTGNFTVNLTVTCEDDSMLIAEGLTANSTWKNITVTTLPVIVVHLVVRTSWTNTSAVVGANVTVSNATYAMSDTTSSSGLTNFSLTTGLYKLTVEYDEVNLLNTTIYLNTDITVTCKVSSEPFETIDERKSELAEARKQATNRLYIGIGGGVGIGVVIGLVVVFFLRKKS